MKYVHLHLVIALSLVCATPAYAHHEAMFGPQSAAGLFSLEKKPFATIAYVYYHHRGVGTGSIWILKHSGT